jgi:transposase-like protein
MPANIKIQPSEIMCKEFKQKLHAGTLKLSEILKFSAQVMLQLAIEQEANEFLEREYYQNAPEKTAKLGRRNGYYDKTIITAEGPIELKVPQIRASQRQFRSQILSPYAKRTETLEELIKRMYVNGMSVRDIERTFKDVFQCKGISKSTVSRINERLGEDLEKFQRRNLSQYEIIYLYLDGTYVRYRVQSEHKEPVLAAYGITSSGKRILLSVGSGNRESYHSWQYFLRDMVKRNLNEPLLVITDGSVGLIKAVEEIFPRSLRQRCQRHKMENILSKVPLGLVDEIKQDILRCYRAKDFETGKRLASELILKYQDTYPSAIKAFDDDLESSLTCLRFPRRHRVSIRTTNHLERLFGENRRRVKVVPHFFSEHAGLKLIYATLLSASRRWQGVRIDEYVQAELDELRKEIFDEQDCSQIA